MRLEMPEWLRKTVGILGIITMFFGSYPPAMGTPVGFILLGISFALTGILFAATFEEFLPLVFMIFLGIGFFFMPSVLYCYFSDTKHDDTWRALALMAFLMYFGMAYLGLRILYVIGAASIARDKNGRNTP